MGVFARLSEAVRGARKLEIFLGIALAAAAGILLIGGGADTGCETALEKRLARTLSDIAGAGEVSVLINEAEDGEVTGVLIVAEGADEVGVKLRLLGAVEAALGVDASRIEIIEMGGTG